MNAEALTIINSYRDHADFNELLGVDRDQSAMSHLFEDLGYRVTVLRDRKRDTILDAIEAAVERLSPGGRLVVYYSGHGETIHGKDVLICTEVRQRYLDQLDGVIPLELLRLRTESRGLRRLILNDSCRSNRYRQHKGGDDRYRGASSVKDIVAAARDEADIEGYPSTFTVLNGCSEDQVAIDLGATVGGLCSAAFRQLTKVHRQSGSALQIDQDFVYTHLAAAMKQLAAEHRHGFCPQPWLCGPVFELVGSVPPGGEIVSCPHCGRRSELRQTFRCRLCGQDHLCLDHFDAGDRACEACVASAKRKATAEREAAEAEARRKAESETPKSLELDCGQRVMMKLALIPSGKFMMGSPDDDKDAHVDEKPRHRVTITRPFYMGVYPVTQAQWRAVMGSNPSDFKGNELPVEQVSWADAEEFCGALSARIGRVVRLPTEAEWEYACRAGSTTRFSFGDDAAMLGPYGWFGRNSGSKTHPVGQKKPNAWGLYDMHGNVVEWCQDWYGTYPTGEVEDPKGPADGAFRVLRGGSWREGPRLCRSAYRYWFTPDYRYYDFGFRVVLDLGTFDEDGESHGEAQSWQVAEQDASLQLMLTDTGAVHRRMGGGKQKRKLPKNQWLMPGQNYTVETLQTHDPVRFELVYDPTGEGDGRWLAPKPTNTIRDVLEQLGFPGLHPSDENPLVVQVRILREWRTSS